MSFISKRYIIKIPSEICVIYDKNKNLLLIKSKKKKKLLRLNLKLLILKEKNLIIVTNQISNTLNSFSKTYQGILVSLIKQALLDVKVTTHKKLKLVGVGYKVFEEFTKFNEKLLHFKLGYSHSLYYKIPKNISIKIHQSTKMFVSGHCLFNISQCASNLRKFKIPEPYKGKGILYVNEHIKLKEGKKV